MESDPDGQSDVTMRIPPEPQTFGRGRYTLIRPLGEGGQKIVYLVHDSVLDRECALSMVRSALLDEEDLRRLNREAQAMARLGAHSHIVTVFDYGDQDGTPYLVCEYVPGGDLRQELAVASGSPLPLDRALSIGAELADALAAAHARGVIHRDVKPANIWLDIAGHAKLGDFGLAFSLDWSRLTMPMTMMGTASYVSPEQIKGQPASERSDLYALGCVLYEMLCGRPPFVDDNPAVVIAQHLNAVPDPPSAHNNAVSAAVDGLVMGLLEKRPERRPATAQAVVDKLQALRGGGAESTSRKSLRRRTLLLLGAAAALVVAAAFGAVVLFADRDSGGGFDSTRESPAVGGGPSNTATPAGGESGDSGVLVPLVTSIAQGCQNARVFGQPGGWVEVCFVRSDSFNGDQYQINVKQVDGPGTATVGISEQGGNGYGFRNPADATFDVGRCTSDALSFEMGFAPGTVLDGVVFAHVATEVGDVQIEYGTGRLEKSGFSPPPPCSSGDSEEPPSPPLATVANGCLGARVLGQLSGVAEVCYLRSEASGEDRYKVTIKQVDVAGEARVGVSQQGGNAYQFANPALSTFKVDGCTNDVLSFELGFPAGTGLDSVVFAQDPDGTEFGVGELEESLRALPPPC